MNKMFRFQSRSAVSCRAEEIQITSGALLDVCVVLKRLLVDRGKKDFKF